MERVDNFRFRIRNGGGGDVLLVTAATNPAVLVIMSE